MREGQMTPASTSCATCKTRGLRCDRARPNCTNCSRSRRKCQWYGLRLSWPRDNDRRRAVVSKSTRPAALRHAADQVSEARFIHTSPWDIELYHSLTRSVPVQDLPLLDVPIIWNTYQLEDTDRDLLDYFCNVASSALATFGHDATALGNILVRVALEGDTPAATAVLKALLAFASLHRYGFHAQALEIKIAALTSLAETQHQTSSLSARETVRHAAVGMLLCSFEVHQSSCTSGHWTGYLGGVKTVVGAWAADKLLSVDSGVAVLLDWVRYHDVLARFSLLYWSRGGAPELPATPGGLFCPEIFNLPQPILPMLDLLYEVCRSVSSGEFSPGPDNDMDDYKSFLEVMDWRIRSLPIPTEDDSDATLVVQLFQLAMLVHLDRSSEGLIGQPARTQQHIDKAFEIFRRMKYCKQQFPVHVLGFEARTDEQRAVVLDLIDRTEKLDLSRSFNYCKIILQAVWAQDDLAFGNGVRYRQKLTSVMNHCKIVPSFT